MDILPRTFSVLRAATLLLAVTLLVGALPANAAHPSASIKEDRVLTSEEKFIQSLGDQAIEILTDAGVKKQVRKEKFRKLMRDSFNLKKIARFVLGRNWRMASKEERKEYLALFESLVIKTYSDRFALYTGEGFIVVSAKKEGKKDYVVNSHITRPNGAPATTVAWRVRNKKGKMGILDVMVEGVSMSVTQRQEYSSIIQRNGGSIEALLGVMRDRVGVKKQVSTAAAS